MSKLSEKQKTTWGVVLVAVLVLAACLVASLPLSACTDNKRHEPRNVFEEIYKANDMARGMTDQVEGISYAHDIFQYDSWYGDKSVLYYSSETDSLIITCTKEVPTITFSRIVDIDGHPSNGSYHYTYLYEFDTQTLTYTTNDSRASSGDSFLFDVFLMDWFESNHPEGEQLFKTKFSPEDWGEYELVAAGLE